MNLYLDFLRSPGQWCQLAKGHSRPERFGVKNGGRRPDFPLEDAFASAKGGGAERVAGLGRGQHLPVNPCHPSTSPFQVGAEPSAIKSFFQFSNFVQEPGCIW
jgi:hypothetical protein